MFPPALGQQIYIHGGGQDYSECFHTIGLHSYINHSFAVWRRIRGYPTSNICGGLSH